mmetsp:Transcript_65724/g.155691  ORF Transcript_65724/g.155691 Transcript_65724/m.155691 type:complete len:330 (+) Transcript_65724:681-1670(+)
MRHQVLRSQLNIPRRQRIRVLPVTPNHPLGVDVQHLESRAGECHARRGANLGVAPRDLLVEVFVEHRVAGRGGDVLGEGLHLALPRVHNPAEEPVVGDVPLEVFSLLPDRGHRARHLLLGPLADAARLRHGRGELARGVMDGLPGHLQDPARAVHVVRHHFDDVVRAEEGEDRGLVLVRVLLLVEILRGAPRDVVVVADGVDAESLLALEADGDFVCLEAEHLDAPRKHGPDIDGDSEFGDEEESGVLVALWVRERERVDVDSQQPWPGDRRVCGAHPSLHAIPLEELIDRSGKPGREEPEHPHDRRRCGDQHRGTHGDVQWSPRGENG